MKARFKSDFDNANKILAEYLTENEYLNSARIIRCVVFLSQNGIESLKSNLNLAKIDPRDIILWAEYENPNEMQPHRVRDFNNPFVKTYDR